VSPRSEVVKRLENNDRSDRGEQELEGETLEFCYREYRLKMRYQLLEGFVKIYWELQRFRHECGD
jgi:hypothetical protein